MEVICHGGITNQGSSKTLQFPELAIEDPEHLHTRSRRVTRIHGMAISSFSVIWDLLPILRLLSQVTDRLSHNSTRRW